MKPIVNTTLLECPACEDNTHVQMKKVLVGLKSRTLTVHPDGNWSSTAPGWSKDMPDYIEGRAMIVTVKYYCSNCDTHFKIEQDSSGKSEIVKMTIATDCE